jgi:hypothetical protein
VNHPDEKQRSHYKELIRQAIAYGHEDGAFMKRPLRAVSDAIAEAHRLFGNDLVKERDVIARRKASKEADEKLKRKPIKGAGGDAGLTPATDREQRRREVLGNMKDPLVERMNKARERYQLQRRKIVDD